MIKEFKFKDVDFSVKKFTAKFDIKLYCPICKNKINIGEEAVFISNNNELFPSVDCHIKCLPNDVDDKTISYLANYYNDLLFSLKIWFPNRPDEIKNLLGDEQSFIGNSVEKQLQSLAGSLLEKSFNKGNEITIPSLGIKVKKNVE